MDASSVRQPAPGSQRRVPTSTRVLFGVGAIAEGVKNTAFNVFLLFYYNQVLGVSGTWTGVAIFLALCVDAIADPLIGSLSDGWRSRFGRRHPFMYAAALPMAVCFALLFLPPDGLSERALAAWLLVFAVGVRVSMTLYVLPSNAMVPELTSDYDERTGLVAWRFLFGWLGGIGISLAGYLVFFASRGVVDGRLDPSRYAGFGLACAVTVAAAILASAAGTHRVIPQLARAAEGPGFSLARFAGELRDVLAVGSYRTLIGAALFAAVAGGFSDVVGLYVNTYFWEFSSEQIAVLVYGLVPGVILSFLVARPLSERFDKKRASLALAWFAVCFGPLPIFLRLIGWFPENGDRLLLPLILCHGVISVALVVSIGITVSSMLADVADEGELRSGKRQEGMFNATISLAMKATSGLGGLVAGISLDLISFPRGADPGSVAPDKVTALGFAVGPGLLALYFVTLAFLARYPITRARHREILDALDLQRLEAMRGAQAGARGGGA
jgi:glycoside/pentoside/hexuronide:cation symporter, GPH family